MPLLQQLLDPAAAAIVLIGTVLAAAAQGGLRETAVTARQLVRLMSGGFDEHRIRATMARLVNRMQHDGVIRTEAPLIDDRELSDATLALVKHRSVAAMCAEHRRHRQRREGERATASGLLGQAAEIAPVLGLAGTLLALAGLSYGDGEAPDFTATVSSAVVSTLYGLSFAHLVLLPLAHAIERAGSREEEAREQLVDWLAANLESSCPAQPIPEVQ